MAYSDLQSRAFTQIAYMNLDEKYVNYCKANRTDTAPLSKLLSTNQYKKLKSLGISDAEIDSWSISGVHNTNAYNGFYACIIETAPGEAAVGFRGSEGMNNLGNVANDWVGADMGLVNSTCTNQQEEVDRFLEKYRKQLNAYNSIAMVGHSLGGNLAEYATIVSYKYGFDDNVKQCVSMDGPGFSKEFIDKYLDQIEKMSGIMYHPRWSFVGTMINDLPGVEYQYVEVSNEANAIDDKDYNAATRHDTKYLIFDENGNLVDGEQDDLSKITSVISEGVDHLPTPIGNALITLVGGVWIGFTWAKENFLKDDGSISDTGLGIIAGTVGLIAAFGLRTVAMTVTAVAVAIISVVAVAVVAELVYDAVMAVADAICDAVQQFGEQVEGVFVEFRNTVVGLIDNAKEWLNNNFNSGYKAVTVDPIIRVDTTKLRSYADRLESVNKRLGKLDKRMDDLYLKVGLRDLFNLLQTDLLTGSSWRISNCVKYLEETANDFDSTERNVAGQF